MEKEEHIKYGAGLHITDGKRAEEETVVEVEKERNEDRRLEKKKYR